MEKIEVNKEALLKLITELSDEYCPSDLGLDGYCDGNKCTECFLKALKAPEKSCKTCVHIAVSKYVDPCNQCMHRGVIGGVDNYEQ